MKAQKSYRFNELVADVIRNIQLFRADPKMIKEQIDVLIDTGYMERDANNRA